MLATITYITIIPLCNWLFMYVPVLTLAPGMQWSPVSLLFGLVFVARDFAQRDIGHGIWLAMGVATALTFWLAAPALALVAAVAFAFGEVADWLVYSVTRRPMSQRVLLSSLVSVPVDSLLALWGLQLVLPGVMGWASIWPLIATKLVAAAVCYLWLSRHEQRATDRATVPSN